MFSGLHLKFWKAKQDNFISMKCLVSPLVVICKFFGVLLPWDLDHLELACFLSPGFASYLLFISGLHDFSFFLFYDGLGKK